VGETAGACFVPCLHVQIHPYKTVRERLLIAFINAIAALVEVLKPFAAITSLENLMRCWPSPFEIGTLIPGIRIKTSLERISFQSSGAMDALHWPR